MKTLPVLTFEQEKTAHFICMSAFNIKLYKFHDVSFQSDAHEKGCARD